MKAAEGAAQLNVGSSRSMAATKKAAKPAMEMAATPAIGTVAQQFAEPLATTKLSLEQRTRIAVPLLLLKGSFVVRLQQTQLTSSRPVSLAALCAE